jgi:hypothetical protein
MPAKDRHVWVQAPDHHTPPDPGMLITWQRSGSTWWARVITLVDLPGHSSALLQRWGHQQEGTPAPTRSQSRARNRWHLGWKSLPPSAEPGSGWW